MIGLEGASLRLFRLFTSFSSIGDSGIRLGRRFIRLMHRNVSRKLRFELVIRIVQQNCVTLHDAAQNCVPAEKLHCIVGRLSLIRHGRVS